MDEANSPDTHVEEFETIVRIVGAVAHDLINVVAAMRGYTDIAQEAIGDQLPHAAACLANQQSVAHRAENLARLLQGLSRASRSDMSLIPFAQFLNESLPLLRKSLPNGTAVRIQMDDTTTAINADRAQMLQVLLGVCNRVAQGIAPPCDGIRVLLDTCMPGDVSHLNLQPGPYARLRVQPDTDADSTPNRNRYLETPPGDPAGIATRVGLPMLHRIVQDHAGCIDCWNDGKSTVLVDVFLPAIERVFTQKPDADTNELPRGDERILLVDDEAIILRTLSRVLLSLGYHVTTRQDSSAALDLVLGGATRYDLILTDLTMPGISGTELAQRICEVRPDVRVLLYTGEEDLPRFESQVYSGIIGVLKKPIVKSELALAIRRALDK